MGIHVTVDPDLCIGSGDCVRSAPDAFRLDEDAGVAEPLEGAGTSPEALLVRVAIGCPTQAIRLVRADGTVLHESN